MSVALSIAFTGLCALVTDGDRGPAQVLLVDASGVGEVGGVALPVHAPTLVASLRTLANAETSGPTRVVGAGPGRGGVDQIGFWDLTGSEVRIRIPGREGGSVELYRPPAGTTSWPEPPRDIDDESSWRDPRFLPSMQLLTGDGRIDPRLVVSHDSAALPQGVAARVRLETGTLEAGIPSQKIHRDEVFEFRSAGKGPAHRQALTDTFRWSSKTDASAVIVEIVPVAGGPVRRLALAPSAAEHELFISNLPAENVPHDGHHAVSEEEMGVLHFGAYYELLRNKPEQMPLPWVWRAEGEPKGTGLAGRPMCSPAWFLLR